MDHRTTTPRLIPPRRLWGLSSWLLSHVSGRAYKLTVDKLGGPNARSDYGLLAGLQEFGPVSQAELGRRLGMDRKSIVVVLDRLQANGLARRATDPSDPRRNTVTITPDGLAALHHADKKLAAAHEKLLEPLDQHERRQLNVLLQRLVEHHFGAPSPATSGENNPAADHEAMAAD